MVLDSVQCAGWWTISKEGIYFFRPSKEYGRNDMGFCDLASSTTRKLLTIDRPVDAHIEVSPDGRTLLYTQVDEAGSDLMLVENFR